MSVLIKGMEMPKCCAGCKILCDAKSKTGLIRPFGERLQTCPLAEVPPHGRLIDADALVNNCEKYIKTLNPDRDGKEIAKIRWLVGVLNEQQTIIEAEGSEE